MPFASGSKVGENKTKSVPSTNVREKIAKNQKKIQTIALVADVVVRTNTTEVAIQYLIN